MQQPRELGGTKPLGQTSWRERNLFCTVLFISHLKCFLGGVNSSITTDKTRYSGIGSMYLLHDNRCCVQIFCTGPLKWKCPRRKYSRNRRPFSAALPWCKSWETGIQVIQAHQIPKPNTDWLNTSSFVYKSGVRDRRQTLDVFSLTIMRVNSA